MMTDSENWIGSPTQFGGSDNDDQRDDGQSGIDGRGLGLGDNISGLSIEEYQTLRRLMEKLQSFSNTKLSTMDTPSQFTGYINSSLFAQSDITYIDHALSCMDRKSSSWVMDSGASSHMTGDSTSFRSYFPCSGRDKVRIADGSFTSISGKGSVDCTPALRLSSVLHVPSFPTNLLSISSLTRDLNCSVTFCPSHCLIQELKMGKTLGCGKLHNGLYYLEDGHNLESMRKGSAFVVDNAASEIVLHHQRLGHIPFSILGSLGKTSLTPPSSGQRSTPVMEQETDKDETQVSSVRKAMEKPAVPKAKNATNYKHMCKIRGSRFAITVSAKIKYKVRIPVKFSRSNDLSSARQMLLRDPEGHPWPVNLLHYCKHSASGPDWSLLSAGWRDFLIGNELKDGDVCVFELKNKSEMLVQIRRLCEDGSSARSKSPLQQVVRPSNKRAATLQQKQKGSPSMVTRSSKPADHPAQFSSIIVPTNLCKKGNMNIPKAFLSLVDLSAEKEAVLVDPHSRRRWPVKICNPRSEGRRRLEGVGWARFCDENDLQVGDVCVFSFKNHTKKREACTFQVEVIKPSKT